MDVFRAELQATRLKNALVEQQARRETAIDQLRGLLGVAADVPLEIDARLAGIAADASGAAPAPRPPPPAPPPPPPPAAARATPPPAASRGGGGGPDSLRPAPTTAAPADD